MNERLTKVVCSHAYGAEGVSKDKLTGKYCRGEFEATACIEKLANYENLEEQGRLIELPCRVGDTVYEVGADPSGNFHVFPYEVQDISARQIMYCDDWCNLEEYKNNIFFDHEAAVAKLKELRGNGKERKRSIYDEH